MAFPRGAMKSPAHKAFATAPVTPRADVPSKFAVVPPVLSMWANDQYGVCVTSEEAFSKAVDSIKAGLPEILITSQEVVNWAYTRGFLNGANLTDVMEAMQRTGLKAPDGKTYQDGPYKSVDWTNDAALRTAIFTGPVKIAVAASQLEGVAGMGQHNGWFAHGFHVDQATDHCVSLCGYGTLAECAGFLNIPVPTGMDPFTPCYLLYTWSTVGIIDRQSLVNFTTEAWVRNPTTVGLTPVPTPIPTPPVPTPTPTPPAPTPTPTPGPSMWDQILAYLTWFLGSLTGSINLQAAEQIVVQALMTGGPFAVIPALIAGINTWVTSPILSMVIVSLLRLLMVYLPASGNVAEAIPAVKRHLAMQAALPGLAS